MYVVCGGVYMYVFVCAISLIIEAKENRTL